MLAVAAGIIVASVIGGILSLGIVMVAHEDGGAMRVIGSIFALAAIFAASAIVYHEALK